MGQFWTLKNIDRQDRFGGAKLGEWLFQSSHSDLLKELMVPVQFPKDYDEWLQAGERAIQRAPLFKLPNEIFGVVFEDLQFEDLSLLCFAITCKDLLALAKQPILQAMNRAIPTWAFCRLICLGDNAEDISDLPSGMLTEEELARIENALVARGLGDVGSDETLPEAEYESVADLLVLVGEPPRLKLRKKELDHGYRRLSSKSVLDADFRFMEHEILQPLMRGRSAPSRPSPKQCLWDASTLKAFVLHRTKPAPEVLCNVSKREFVRRDALPKVPTFREVTLAHALIVQVLWSPDPSCGFRVADEYDERISRGPWAGDRFCVTTMATMPELAPGMEGWRDVSEEVAGFLDHLLY
ncbi:hypothetical protein GY45DRAFT_966156 [Cubamyces sp. BRFM 1775]|nr:hypothetical protein GY45DRAFT_966156 [Cubamyces sp. BRFM 1775]